MCVGGRGGEDLPMETERVHRAYLEEKKSSKTKIKAKIIIIKTE